MPNYKVRMNTGDGPDGDETIDFRDSATACRDAQVAMVEVARDTIPGQTKAHVGVEIDDENGEPVYRAERDFKGKLGGASQPAADTADELGKGPRD